MPLAEQKKRYEVTMQCTAKNNRIEVPGRLVDRFDFVQGTPFVWTWDPETRRLWCEPKAQIEEDTD